MIKYLGIANIAKQKWCHQYFKYCSKKEESGFRAKYNLLEQNGGEIVHKAPESLKRNSLRIGKIIKLERFKKMDLFSFLKLFNYSLFIPKSIKDAVGCRPIDMNGEIFLKDRFAALNSKEALLIKKSVDRDFQIWKKRLVEKRVPLIYVPGDWRYPPWGGLQRVDVVKENKTNLFLLGKEFEKEKAEKYPTIEKHFTFGERILIGIPDGVTKDFCYEFKRTTTLFWYPFHKPVALAQANLYSFLFKKSRIRVQIYILETDTIETFEQKTDRKEALLLLRDMEGLLENKIKPFPPRKCKCLTCEFQRGCSLKKYAR